jgi:hypothetical protein
MSRTLYVCITCTQEFTRKGSADRHNINIHEGRSIIVRFLDYVIGTVTGRYRLPDPSLHPRSGRKRSREYYQFGSKASPLGRHTPSYRINHGMGESNKSSESSPFAEWDICQEAADKVVEIKKCLGKLFPPWEAHKKAKRCLEVYSVTKDVGVLDRALAALGRMAKFSDTLQELNYQRTNQQISKASSSNIPSMPLGSPSNNNIDDLLDFGGYQRQNNDPSMSYVNSSANTSSYRQPPTSQSLRRGSKRPPSDYQTSPAQPARRKKRALPVSSTPKQHSSIARVAHLTKNQEVRGDPYRAYWYEWVEAGRPGLLDSLKKDPLIGPFFSNNSMC